MDNEVKKIDDLKIIKKNYGEAMMHFARSNFGTILEYKGKLSEIFLSHFEPNKDLFSDIENNQVITGFKNYIYSFFFKDQKEEIKEEIETPKELLKKAGYTLFECKTEKDIQSFIHYYKKGEELCTFKNERLKTCYVFFAIKDNVDDIKREDFKVPRRQDAYGTSVISIQFSRDPSHTLSIKNRYNHTVDDPDATFSNDLDNIIPGLTDSFEKHYGMVQKYKTGGFVIPGYVLGSDGKFYKFNYERNDVYYCTNNKIIRRGRVETYAKEKIIVFDYFILDLVNKNIKLYDKMAESFMDLIKNINKISILNTYYGRKITIQMDNKKDIIIKIDKNNRMIGYINNNKIDKIPSDFLRENMYLKELEMNGALEASNSLLEKNKVLEHISMESLEVVGNYFLENSSKLKKIDFPKLKVVGNNAFYRSQAISINLPKLEKIGYDAFVDNTNAIYVSMPKLKITGSNFFYEGGTFEELYFPKLKISGACFLKKAKNLKQLVTPKLETAEVNYLYYASNLEYFYAPRLKRKEECLCVEVRSILNYTTRKVYRDIKEKYRKKI